MPFRIEFVTLSFFFTSSRQPSHNLSSFVLVFHLFTQNMRHRSGTIIETDSEGDGDPQERSVFPSRKIIIYNCMGGRHGPIVVPFGNAKRQGDMKL